MAAPESDVVRADGSRVILATKLHPPRARRGTIERPRLTGRTTGELPALTLVSAPAGFGKTTFVADWLTADPERDTTWLSLDPSDSDPATFWPYVIAAIQTAVPAAGRDASAMLQAAQPVESVVSSLLNDLASITRDVVLVLDDYHLIDSLDVHHSVTFLLEHLPPTVRVVLSARADPPLPLARLRARGELLEVRAADLRFTPDEACRFFDESMGLTLTTADIDVLETRTEGWIAALQLAALSMQGRDDTSGFIRAFAGDDRFVVDYLAEEVLERQPDDVRRFLLDTAVLDRFDASLCDAVTGTSAGKAMLERLDRANLFLVPLDDRRRWYRYHHLFADVLRARLLDDGSARIDALHRRASAWFEAAGDQPAAITHALAGHDADGAARLIELVAPQLFRTRQERTARRWLTSLPPDLFPDRPVLSMELVAAHMVSGDTTGVEALLDGIDRWLDPGTDITKAIVFNQAELADLPAQVAVYRAALALIAGDIALTIAHAHRALDLARPSDHLRHGSAAALVGLAEWRTGDLEGACRHYTDAISALTAAGHINDVLGCSIALADMRLVQGRLSDALRTYESGLELARVHQVVRGAGDMQIGISEVLLERDDRPGAARHLDASAQLGEQGGLPQHAYRWRVAAARLCEARGERAAALELLEHAEHVYDTDLSPPVRPVAAMKARAQIAAGDLAGPHRWADTCDLAPDDDLAYVREYEHVTLARLLVADGAIDDAIRLLHRLAAAAEEGQRAGSATEILVVLVLALAARGDRASALATLEVALAQAAPESHVRPFTAELPALLPLLRAVTGAGPARDLARRVLSSTPSPAPAPVGVAAGALVDPLSSRELDVLRLLRGDLSGPDIARELVVSLNTVRTHTKSIYLKLGVSSRREAVRRADELGL